MLRIPTQEGQFLERKSMEFMGSCLWNPVAD